MLLKFVYCFSGVLAPMSLEMVKDALKSKNFISLSTDSSNRGNVKLLPVMVRYYCVEEGIQCKLLTLSKLSDETGESVFGEVKSTAEKFDLRSKFVSFGADNCPTNFGGITRGGEQNVFARIQEEFEGHKLIGIGCSAHLVHKAIEIACHKFQSFFDIEAIVVKIYGYFKHITVRNTRLQQLFSDDDDSEIKLLGYSNTRFIGFKKCIDRIIEHFSLLKAFFEDENDAPLQVLKFFDHQLSKLFLIFVRDQCALFESTIKAMEGSQVLGFEVAKAVKWLLDQIESRQEEEYASFDLQREMDVVKSQLPFKDTISVKRGKEKTQNVEVMVNEEYLKETFDRFYGKIIFFLPRVIT